MILLNNFYNVTELTHETARLNAVITINPGHDIFKGHFPDQPVVPGVCMVQIVKELMEQYTDKKLVLSKGHQLKFLQLLVPVADEAIQVNISWSENNSEYNITADFRKNNEAAFKMAGLFIPR
jgi:3-hydroxyacyl-[acyl-carrier-protein] dehydratase